MATSLTERASVAESPASAVAWPAIIGGAFAAAALALILLALGAGVDLSTASPWSGSAGATTFTVGAAVWLIVVQWLSSGLGGYLTGRLRTKWVGLHSDEVFFRDTAHGFLTWAVASVITVAFLASATSSIIGAGTRVAGGVAASAAGGAGAVLAQQANGGGLTGYYVDALYRSDHPTGNAADIRVETARVLARAAVNGGTVPAAGKAYLSQLDGAQTGLSKADADKRVNEVLAQEQAAESKLRQVADEARKAGAKLAFYIFFSMLVGAFIA
ncbi:MAG: hypothetical protein ACREF3_14435, partial [Acetobacteraceae bacterium]